MRFISLSVLGFCTLLAACGTPQERCISSGTRDLRTLGELIEESEATLARGYAMVEVETSRPSWEQCGWMPPRQPGGAPEPRMCWVSVPDTVTRPMSVDLNAERAKLASMKQRQTELSANASKVVAQCRKQFPEG